MKPERLSTVEPDLATVAATRNRENSKLEGQSRSANTEETNRPGRGLEFL
jgi:hypothetical protein